MKPLPHITLNTVFEGVTSFFTRLAIRLMSGLLFWAGLCTLIASVVFVVYAAHMLIDSPTLLFLCAPLLLVSYLAYGSGSDVVRESRAVFTAARNFGQDEPENRVSLSWRSILLRGATHPERSKELVRAVEEPGAPSARGSGQ